MNKQLLGNWPGIDGKRLIARFAPYVRRVVFARVAMTVLMIPSGVAATTTPPLSIPTARAVDLDLAGVFRTQTESGSYAFTDGHAGISTYPVMASMSLDSYRTVRNTAALSHAAYSIGKYYTYLVGSRDRDGDRLIESAAPWGGKDAIAEDPAYNALLAVDMRALARINLELRRVMPALFWYEGYRATARATIGGTYDGDAAFFFPNNAVTNRGVRQWSVLAALPITFDEFIGINQADAVVRRHLSRWSREFAAAGTNPGTDVVKRAIERMVGVDVMRATGHNDDADVLRVLPVLSSSTSESIALYATERAMIDRPLKDPDIELDLFYAIMRGSQRFTDPEVVRIEKCLQDARSILSGTTPPPPIEDGEAAVRTLYATISQLRDKLRASAFWSPEERAAFPGVDATMAAGRLLDEVSGTLRRVESIVFVQRFGAMGVRVATQFPKDSGVVGENALLSWELSSDTRPFEVKSLMAGVFGEALTPVTTGKPLAILPGAPARFSSKHLLKGTPGSLRLVTYTLMLEDAAGHRGRYHVERSVFAHPPVGIRARFPDGRIIAGDRVPIELDMTRRARSSPPTRYYWFSPSGLRLAEGNQGAFAFGSADSATATVHVEIPSPCRPGVFPFTLKFLAGDREAGTIQASLFKPYQWAFVGSFAGGNLERKLAPENGVAVLKAFDAGKRKLQWKPVPASACGPRGEIVMRNLMDEPGAGYLYTVVAVANETDIGVRLVSNCPAALFINGKRVVANTAEAGDSSSATIHLQADKNHILLKVVGDATATVAFGLGNDDNIAADEFNNDLALLVEGYNELLARSQAKTDTPSEARRLVTFRYDDGGANAVSVVGSFNGWSPETHRMEKLADGRWELTLSLVPGRYGYRFLVDQKKQVLDPSSELTEPDGYGGKNSVVVVAR